MGFAGVSDRVWETRDDGMQAVRWLCWALLYVRFVGCYLSNSASGSLAVGPLCGDGILFITNLKMINESRSPDILRDML
jgi:hypothetical protein